MISNEEAALIADIAKAIGKSSEFVIQQYGTWFIASAICWVALGIAICVFAFRVKFSDKSDIAPIGQNLIRAAIAFIGFLFIAGNVPDLVSPKAAAVHQLIKDVRSSK